MWSEEAPSLPAHVCSPPPFLALDPPVSRTGQAKEALRNAEKRPGKAAASEESVRKEPSNYSYQQINCLDGIIR